MQFLFSHLKEEKDSKRLIVKLLIWSNRNQQSNQNNAVTMQVWISHLNNELELELDYEHEHEFDESLLLQRTSPYVKTLSLKLTPPTAISLLAWTYPQFTNFYFFGLHI